MKKDLTEYNFPQDLKDMTTEEMKLLTYSIRDFLVEKTSKTGGHVASNLGVVELSVVLHKVFDSPTDKIIWDVGHQSYVHKILTGRSKGFDTLRQLDGMSGFPKSKESDHDVYETGHSSTSLAAAAGFAAARDLKGEKYQVIAVIGDGSLTGGMAFEALNNIGASRSKVIVVLNDNGMSISQNIGGLSTHLGNLRTSKGYLSAKRFIRTKVEPIPSIGKFISKALANFKNDLKYSLMSKGGILFEELGFTYLGPVDGHNIDDLIEVFDQAKKINEPILIHVISKKGKGYKNAEKYPGKFHGIGPYDIETGKPLSKSNLPSFSSVMGNHLVKMAKTDSDIVAISAAMCDGTGLEPFKDKFPDRFFDVGIAEQYAVSFAAGLAKNGMKPLVAVYSTFLQRSYDQIIEDVCLQNLPVVFALDRAGIVGADGETHNGLFDFSYMSIAPNMTVLAPKDGTQLIEMMEYAFSLGTPCSIRYPRGTTTADEKEAKAAYTGNSSHCFDKRVCDGEQLDILTTGKMSLYAEEIREALLEKGIHGGIVKVGQVKPLNLDDLHLNSKMIVTVEDHSVMGGFGQMVSGKYGSQTERIISFGWPDKFIEHGTFDQLRERYGLMPNQIAERIYEEIERL